MRWMVLDKMDGTWGVMLRYWMVKVVIKWKLEVVYEVEIQMLMIARRWKRLSL
ncbi:hypothetical protein Hdeb2414_s0023g00627131 [Helianthus debilis subsp. tardiflorus]